jgi:hypothetical protein
MDSVTRDVLVAEESNAGTGGRGRDGGCWRPFSSILVSGFVCVGDSTARMAGCEEKGGGTVGIGKSLCMIWTMCWRNAHHLDEVQ